MFSSVLRARLYCTINAILLSRNKICNCLFRITIILYLRLINNCLIFFCRDENFVINNVIYVDYNNFDIQNNDFNSKLIFFCRWNKKLLFHIVDFDNIARCCCRKFVINECFFLFLVLFADSLIILMNDRFIKLKRINIVKLCTNVWWNVAISAHKVRYTKKYLKLLFKKYWFVKILKVKISRIKFLQC